MPMCIDTGLGIYVYSAEKANDTYAGADWIPFDNASQALALRLDRVLSEPDDAKSHLTKYANRIPTIKVTGNLVASDYRGLSDYGDWSQAIHIHSIEFHYINGVSNYEVVAPENVVLTE